ncbi:MAG: DUF2064 domain-containing protein [Pseudomonadota bacterium]
MRCAVAIFTKTIGYSKVKTRLAQTIGQSKAEEFFTLSIACVEEMVSLAGEAFPEQISAVWAVAEEEALSAWSPRSFPAIWTGCGQLGTRLATVSQTLFQTHDAVIMIGTDSPQLSPNVLIETLSLLVSGEHRFVAGPALDGGFYLFGSTVPVPRKIWEGVAYSRNDTLVSLEAELVATGGTVKRIGPEQDVDVLEDLVRLKRTLESADPLPGTAKHTLLGWLSGQTLF